MVVAHADAVLGSTPLGGAKLNQDRLPAYTSHQFSPVFVVQEGSCYMRLQIPIDRAQIEAFCRKWKIAEFAFFGSVLRDDFRPDSDVDVLVTFADDAHWSSYEWVDMIDELERHFGRKVDLVSSRGLRNPFRRRAILSSRQVLYAA